MLKALCVVSAFAVFASIGATPASNAQDVPPFIPIERTYLPLPKGVTPFLPVFIEGGKEILFQNIRDNGAWIIRADGTDPLCITCGFPDRPNTRGGFAYAFPDGKRLLLSKGLGKPGGGDGGPEADVWILECERTLRDCGSHRFLPVDLSADRNKFTIIHRRTWHLAPDGVHLGWMNVRADGTVMIVARLERQGDHYVAADPRAVNPAGPISPADDNADRWENLSQLYELKAFTSDGLGILAVGMPRNNVDVIRIDLATGRVRRLTANPDWDEDTSLSPDQQLMVVNSWRPRQRLDAFAWIPEIRGFTGLMLGAAIAPFYVSTWTGFQCDLSPWLLEASGDRGGTLLGQPLDVYDGDRTAANNLSGQQIWSPDSTMLLLQERSRQSPPAAGALERIAIARLDRAPTRPAAVRSSAVGAWAPAASAYLGPNSSDRTAVVRGKKGGRATIVYAGMLGKGASTTVTFEHFTDDGITFVDGVMRGASVNRKWQLTSDVTVSGRHTGKLTMDLVIDNDAKPLPTKAGTISAVYDGRTAPPIAELAPCYSALPKPSPLRLNLTRRGGLIDVVVDADVYGDVRPVANAVIAFGSQRVRTDRRGRAVLRIEHGATGSISASAGDTFNAAKADVPGR